MAIRRRTSPTAAPSMVADPNGVDPNLVEHEGVDSDGDGIEDVDETDSDVGNIDSDGDGTADEDELNEAAKPWVGHRDPRVPLSAEDNAAILAHEERIVQYNMRRREQGLSEALTKEEQDRVP